MSVQELMNNCCEGLKNAAVSTGEFASTSMAWCGRQVSVAGEFLWDGTQKALDFVRPFFQQVMEFASVNFERAVEFVRENQSGFIFGTIGAAVGAALYALVSNMCCGGSSTNGSAVPTGTQRA